jgi:outer membrane lipoprotein SlyB
MKVQLLAGGALVALLSGCASDPIAYGDPYYYSTGYGDRYYYGDRPAYNRYHDEFRVTSIEVMRGDGGGGTTGAGAVIGGIAGGVLGHQIGSGRGNDAATVAGAIGGAVVGNEIERRRGGADLYRVTVRAPNGVHETYVMETLGTLRVGDRVRIENGRIYPIG